MKKRLLFFALTALLLTLFTITTDADAFPYIEVEGFAIPDYLTLVDNGDGTSSLDVEYRFDVVNSMFDAEMVFLSLEFEGDIFTGFSETLHDGSSSWIDPSDWTVSEASTPWGSTYLLAYAGTPVAEGESLSGRINLTLYTEALTSVSWTDASGVFHDWDEGQIWAQSWYALDSHCGGDGGSTAVPEPGVMLLLGSALLVLGLTGRRAGVAGRR